MTNFGTARIRQDSLTHSRLQNSVTENYISNTTTSQESETTHHTKTGKRGTSEEQGKGILQGVARQISESSDEATASIPESVQPDTNNLQNAAHLRASVTQVGQGSITTELESNSTTVGRSNLRKKKRSSTRARSNTSTGTDTVAKLSNHFSTRTLQAMRPASLLVASLGNPPPYHSTRHSAAHIILKQLQSNLNLPPFSLKSRPYGGGHVSVGADVGRPEFTLWQSPSLMNVSGPPLLKAWKNFLSVQSASPNDLVTGLVVLHDEMETEPGRVKVKRGNTSARGHNGLKSVQASLQGAGLMEALGDRYVKIGIGIGRPSGGTRETRDVSAYVLGQLTSNEKAGLERATSELEGILYQEMARIGQNM